MRAALPAMLAAALSASAASVGAQPVTICDSPVSSKLFIGSASSCAFLRDRFDVEMCLQELQRLVGDLRARSEALEAQAACLCKNIAEIVGSRTISPYDSNSQCRMDLPSE